MDRLDGFVVGTKSARKYDNGVVEYVLREAHNFGCPWAVALGVNKRDGKAGDLCGAYQVDCVDRWW